MKTIVIIALVIIGFLAIVAIVGYASLSSTSFQQHLSKSPNPTTSPQTTSTQSTTGTTIPTSTPTSTPSKSSSSPYVAVNYSTDGLGWYKGYPDNNGFYYTYLVINVTITDYGYSQVNPQAGDFSVNINGKSYGEDLGDYYPMTTNNLPFYVSFAERTSPWLWFTYSYPSPKLADTGSISGWIIFRFGDSSFIPVQPAIANVPFTFKCTITEGSSFPYGDAAVKINQIS